MCGADGTNGLFANVPFVAGETILIITWTVRTSTDHSHYRVGPRWIGIGECTWLVPASRNHEASVSAAELILWPPSALDNAVCTWSRLVVVRLGAASPRFDEEFLPRVMKAAPAR